MRFLDYQSYLANARRHGWPPAYQARWAYHAAAIRVAGTLSLTHPGAVLEIGSFGAQIVPGSDTLDLPQGEWSLPDCPPTWPHDARLLPWPLEAGRYQLLVALRVWHHLAPVQAQCFREAQRVARHLLIVCPEQETVGVGIHQSQWTAWNGGPPVHRETLPGWGNLYLFEGKKGTT